MIMPSHLKMYEDNIRNKIKEFGNRFQYDDVVEWILQFDSEDQSLAIKLFLEITFFSDEQVKKLCKVLYGRLPKGTKDGIKKGETIFVSLGDIPDSGPMLLYHYSKINSIPEEYCYELLKFIDILDTKKGIKSVIFIDDFIGSGDQACTFLSNELMEDFDIVGIKYKEYQALVGFVTGKEAIIKKTGIKVNITHELTNKDRIFHEASTRLTDNYYELKKYREAMLKYGQKLFPSHPLGYRNSQALIVFYYNTPNNTLPVIWATEEWKPLFPRIEPQKFNETTEGEKLLLLGLSIFGGKLYHKLDKFAKSARIDIDDELDLLKRDKFISIKIDVMNKFIELTDKGLRRTEYLIRNDIISCKKVVEIIRDEYVSFLMKTPENKIYRFERLLSDKLVLVNLITNACKIGDVQTVLKLKKTISWILLKSCQIEERIRLGEFILSSFEEETLGSEWGWTKIDDIGWSLVVKGKYSKAKKRIDEGLENLFTYNDIYGLCQRWRHIQGIKVRQERHFEADFGLRVVFGISNAISDCNNRILMQAGILKGLANNCIESNRHELSKKFIDKSITLYKMIGDEYHENEVNKMKQLPSEFTSNDYPGFNNQVIYLVRHPIAIKNKKNSFGRRMLDNLSEDGKKQIGRVSNILLKDITEISKEDIEIYSASSNVTNILADEISIRINKEVHIATEIDSIDCGELTGYSEEDADRKFPSVMKELKSFRNGQLDGFKLNFPGGESIEIFYVRFAKLLLDRLYTSSGPRLLILVAHQSSITALLNILTSLDRHPMDPSYRYFEVPLGSVIKVVIDNHANTSFIKRLDI